jgi:hypothetical protein
VGLTRFAVAGLVLAAPLRAQVTPVTVVAMRGVTFGAVLPGIPETVSPVDPANSAQFDITGPNGQVLLSFVLPLSMTGPGGAVMSMTFGPGDGGYSPTQTIVSQVGFDPTQSLTVSLPSGGRASIFVGATVFPSINQRAGPYTATVTLNVTVLP